MTTEASAPSGPIQKLKARDFHDPDVRKVLDAMTLDGITDNVGQPGVVTRYAPTRGNWSQGDRLPALRDDDPAVMQAIGRCATWQIQRKGGFPRVLTTHDEARCAWCGYPLKELLAACDWGVFRSRYVEAEFLVWYADQEKRKGPSYMRLSRHDVYENPFWAHFWALPKEERQARIEAAQYPAEAA